MAATVKAEVTPEVLRWARERANISLERAAKYANISTPQRLDDFERGRRQPTLNQLDKLARLYQRPFAIFYLPEPPKDFDTKLTDFRRTASGTERAQSPELTLQIRRAHVRRAIALDLYRELNGEDPEPFPPTASLQEDPEVVGERIRDFFDVTIDTQHLWTRSEALRRWKQLFETAGVLVFQTTGVEEKETSGFSISEQPFPVVVANGADASSRRIFTLMHELVHIMLNEGGLCDFYDRGSSHKRQVEAFCNRTAAAALIPRRALLDQPTVIMNPGVQEWNEQQLDKLGTYFAVSDQAVLLRLVTFERATQAHYDRMVPVFEKRYAEWKKKQQEKNKDRPSRPPHFRQVLSREGHYFTRLVLTSYNAEKITASDVSDFLDVKLQHLPDISDAVSGRTL